MNHRHSIVYRLHLTPRWHMRPPCYALPSLYRAEGAPPASSLAELRSIRNAGMNPVIKWTLPNSSLKKGSPNAFLSMTERACGQSQRHSRSRRSLSRISVSPFWPMTECFQTAREIGSVEAGFKSSECIVAHSDLTRNGANPALRFKARRECIFQKCRSHQSSR